MSTLRGFALLILVCLSPMPLAGQAGASGLERAKASLTQAEKQGFPLHTDLTVRGNVTVGAVLIPPRVARRIFGGEIAKHYAVIELNVANKSPDAALIIQGAYIDYTNWALSGSVRPDEICKEGLDTDSKRPFKSCTRPNQVASEEYRVVRGQLLNMQPWTPRNTTVRLLTLLGSIATGYSFSIKEVGYNKGINAFTGVVVPGFQTFWPDQTVDQMNRISDFGYQTNKIVPRQGSDIIVCFYPIGRFLTNSFRDLYLKNPAVFFSPFEMLLDKNLLKTFVKKLPAELGKKLQNNQRKLEDLLPCYLKVKASDEPLPPETDRTKDQTQGPASKQDASNTPATTSTANTTPPESPSKQLEDSLTRACLTAVLKDPDTSQILDMIGRVSMNNIRVVIDGVMSVETTILPAKIESVEFEGEKTNPKLWTNIKTPKAGTIKGAYLTGGTPRILNADKYIKEIKAVTAGSTDETLKFTATLKDVVPDQTQLTFVVEKKAKDSSGAEKTIESNPSTYRVEYVSVPSSQPSSSTRKEPSGSER